MTQAASKVFASGPSSRARSCRHPLETYLLELHGRHADCREGQVASYIPELSKADPSWFGIAVATVDGQVYKVGDTDRAFTIQSISKPFVYALALQDQGVEAMLGKIGVEPSGDAFNSISLYHDTGRPFNPMINAGAIASTGMVASNGAGRIDRILGLASGCAGRLLSIDEEVYRSERDTGFRNFAIGYMLRNFSIVDSAPEPILDAYFRQCSMLVTCRDLAVMGATLANNGACPLTGEQAIEPRIVPQVLSVMATCGMYDYAGEWIFRIGMSSKSGVGGGIIGVLPGQMAIAVFSPPLDARGNSVRGIRVFNDFSSDFGLHLFRSAPVMSDVVRRRYQADAVRSKRVRRALEARTLAEHGGRIAVYELQGELTLISVERVIRELLELPPRVTHLVVDFRRVFAADRPALDLLVSFLLTSHDQFRAMLLTQTGFCPGLREHLDAELARLQPLVCRCVEQTDTALEFCENELLAELLDRLEQTGPVPLEDFDVCAGLTPERVEFLRHELELREYRDGETIIAQGEAPTFLFFLLSGQVTVAIDLPAGGTRRLTTCYPGMLFGEMAILERRPRSAAVRADGHVECYAMSVERFDRLTATHPDLKVKLLENFAHNLSLRVLRLTDEVRALSE